MPLGCTKRLRKRVEPLSALVMQSPHDPLYQKYCTVLRKQLPRPEKQIEFCKWLSAEFDVPPPVYLAADKPHEKNRLWIVFHTRDEHESFYIHTDEFYGRDINKERAILAKARELNLLDEVDFLDPPELFVKRKRWWQRNKRPHIYNKTKPTSDGWFVAYTAFAPVALSEAILNVSKRKIQNLKNDFLDVGLWHIKPFFSSAIIMFETEAQKRSAETNGVQQKITEAWKTVIRPFDEFKVLEHVDPPITFDSKETFDRDYDGSWFAYTR